MSARADADTQVPEPIEEVGRRVRRRVVCMLLTLLAVPLAYGATSVLARLRPIGVADCLPPGIRLDTPTRDATVADALQRLGARVVNGVLVDAAGRPIHFQSRHATQPATQQSAPHAVVVVTQQEGQALSH